jgi:hypothetical protein
MGDLYFDYFSRRASKRMSYEYNAGDPDLAEIDSDAVCSLLNLN